MRVLIVLTSAARAGRNGGPTGFAVHDRLIPACVPHLKPAAHLLLEIGATQHPGIRERLTAAGLDIGPTVAESDSAMLIPL